METVSEDAAMESGESESGSIHSEYSDPVLASWEVPKTTSASSESSESKSKTSALSSEFRTRVLREAPSAKATARQQQARLAQSQRSSEEVTDKARSVDDRHIFGSCIDRESGALDESGDMSEVWSAGSSAMSTLLGADDSWSPLPYHRAFDTREMLQTQRGTFCTYFAYANDAGKKTDSSTDGTSASSASVSVSSASSSSSSGSAGMSESLSDADSCLESKPSREAVTPHTDGDTLTFVCLHGAGHCGLSWAMVASILKSKHNVMAFDYRAHGDTVIDESETGTIEYDLSKECLVADIASVIESKFDSMNPPPLVLVGHSLGGALAIHTARFSKETGRLPSLQGIVVLDVVEGTALASLVHMKSIIHRRPKSFDSLKHAIKYCYSSGMIRNQVSVRLSTPRMFVSLGKGTDKVGWRTDLMKSAPFWRGWFEGMSEMFLHSPGAKMLMLADTDRLDKTLTIGQMQGKYELKVMGMGVGHTVHEDSPRRVAQFLLAYAQRNQFERMWKMNRKFALKKTKE